MKAKQDAMRYHYRAEDLAAARCLGWVSLGLGILDMFGRRRVAKLTGVDNLPLIGLVGARELLTGFGLLLARDPAPWVWARVGGDAFDLGTLASGVTRHNPRHLGSLVGLMMVAGIAAVDVAIAGRLHATAEREALGA
ncbi:hypothetical protein [Acidisoma sp. 7E03]